MYEPFPISVDCSKVLTGSKETHYTMFIDNTKMSVVYELVEWIRWIFGIESCVYLTHENAVIHELEDIQVLSKLKIFRLKLCGEQQCVHKKLYRTLLNHLNLYTNWNELRVHKYFLDKISQINAKFTRGTTLSITEEKISSGCGFQNESQSYNADKFEKNCQSTPLQSLSSSNKGVGVETTLNNQLVLKKPSQQNKGHLLLDNGNLSGVNGTTAGQHSEPQLKVSGDDSPFTDRCEKIRVTGETNLNINSDYSVSEETSHSELKKLEFGSNNISNDAQKNVVTTKTQFKKSKKWEKPFSLGALLQNIRRDSKEVMEETNGISQIVTPSKEEHFEKNTEECDDSLTPSSFNKEGCLDKNPVSSLNPDSCEDFFLPPNKKRKRVRKRKRNTKETPAQNDLHVSPVGNENIVPVWTLRSPYSDVKPNHIRFNTEEEDDLMETETVGGNDQKEMMEADNANVNSVAFKNEQVKSVNKHEEVLESPPVSNSSVRAAGGWDTDPSQVSELVRSETHTVLNGGDSDNNKIEAEDSQSASLGHELNNLLSLKHKFKCAVVIERFN